MQTPFYAQLPNFEVVTRTYGGKGMYLGVNHVSRPKTAEFQGSPFWRVSYIYVYTL